MAERNTPIRVLVVDDEPEIRDAYKQILGDTEANLEMTGFHELRSRLFRKNPQEALRQAATRATSFETVFCQQAAEAVVAVKEALSRNEPFAVAFIDMRMPPGQDGVWAATHHHTHHHHHHCPSKKHKKHAKHHHHAKPAPKPS